MLSPLQFYGRRMARFIEKSFFFILQSSRNILICSLGETDQPCFYLNFVL